LENDAVAETNVKLNFDQLTKLKYENDIRTFTPDDFSAALGAASGRR
jgi:hypothetical protein